MAKSFASALRRKFFSSLAHEPCRRPIKARERQLALETLEDRTLLTTWADIANVYNDAIGKVRGLASGLADAGLTLQIPLVQTALSQALDIASTLQLPFGTSTDPNLTVQQACDQDHLGKIFTVGYCNLTPESGTNDFLRLTYKKTITIDNQPQFDLGGIGGTIGFDYFDKKVNGSLSGNLKASIQPLQLQVTFGVDLVNNLPQLYVADSMGVKADTNNSTSLKIPGVNGQGNVNGRMNIGNLLDVTIAGTGTLSFDAALKLKPQPDHKWHLPDLLAKANSLKDVVTGEYHGRIHFDATLTTKLPVLPDLTWTGSWEATLNASGVHSGTPQLTPPDALATIKGMVSGLFNGKGAFSLPTVITDALNFKIPLLNFTLADKLGIGGELTKITSLGLPDIGGLLTDLENSLNPLGIYIGIGPGEESTRRQPQNADDLAGLLDAVIRGEHVDLISYHAFGGKQWTTDHGFTLFDIGVPGVADVHLDLTLGGYVGWDYDVGVGIDTTGLYFSPNTHIGVNGGIYAGLSGGLRVFGFDIASAAGRISLDASARLGLRNPDPSQGPRIYLDEIFRPGENLFQSFLNALQVDFALDVTAHVEAKINLFIAKITVFSHDWNLGRLVDVHTSPSLATSKRDMPLVLSTDPQPFNLQPVNGVLTIDGSGNSGGNNVLLSGGQNGAVDLAWLGHGTEHVTGVQQVRFIGGAHDDRLQVRPGFNIPVYAQAGSGTAYLQGGDGNCTLLGGGGNDTLIGGAGSNYLKGGSGDNYLVAGSGPSTLLGGRGTDTLIGGAGPNDLEAGPGNALLRAGSGPSTLIAGPGNDTLYGGAGRDLLQGTSGTVILYAGTGDCTLIGGTGNATLYGGAGADLLIGGTSASANDPSNGNDLIVGGTGRSTIWASRGADTLIGGAGTSEIHGGRGNDLILAGPATTDTASPYLTGGGNDSVWGGNGSNTIVAGGGNDLIYGAPADFMDRNGNIIRPGCTARNNIRGGTGNNLVYAGPNGDLVIAGAGSDTIHGGAGNDTLVAGPGEDWLYAGTGDDLLQLPFGVVQGNVRSHFIGGPGHDTLAITTDNQDHFLRLTQSSPTNFTVGSYANPNWGTVLKTFSFDLPSDIHGNFIQNLALQAINGNNKLEVAPEVGRNVKLIGGTGNDTLVGGGGINILLGGTGDDLLVGGPGTNPGTYNEFHGGTGSTTMLGGAGNDVFYGGTGDNTMLGGNGRVIMYGGKSLSGQRNHDLMQVGAQSQGAVMIGGANDVIMYGGPGNNVLLGGAGNAEMHGGGTDDVLVGGTGNTTMYGGTGYEVLIGGQGSNVQHVDDPTRSTVTRTTEDWQTRFDRLANQAEEVHQEIDKISAQLTDPNLTPDQRQALQAQKDKLVAEHDSIVRSQDQLDQEYLQHTIYHVPDYVIGGAGANVIYGSTTANFLLAGAGPTTIYGGGGDDTVTGTPGKDTFFIPPAPDNANIVFTAQPDGNGNTIPVVNVDAGTTHLVEKIHARGINQFGVITGAGNNNVTVDLGKEGLYNIAVQSGSGNDVIDFQGRRPNPNFQGSATVTGGTGSDTIYGATGRDLVVIGGRGNMMIDLHGRQGKATVTGGPGNDTVIGAGQADLVVNGGSGNNRIDLTGLQGGATVTGGTGFDTILDHGQNNVVINGGNATNWIDLSGLQGKATVNGGTGTDSIKGGSLQGIALSGGRGLTTYEVDGTNVEIKADENPSSLSVFVNGQRQVRIALTATPIHRFVVQGLPGNDTIKLGPLGNFTFPELIADAGPGNTLIDASAVTQAAQRTTLLGGAGSDTLIGGSGPNYFQGKAANTYIKNFKSTDTLVGGGSFQFDGVADHGISQQNWTSEVLDKGAGDSVIIDHRLDPTHGPYPYLYGAQTHHTISYDDDSGYSGVVTAIDLAHTFSQPLPYNPSAQGTITSFDFTFDALNFDSNSVQAGLLLRQGDSYYFGGGVTLQSQSWQHISSSVPAGSFQFIKGSHPSPDFSAPMYFGLFTSTSYKPSIGQRYVCNPTGDICGWELTRNNPTTAAWGLNNFNISYHTSHPAITLSGYSLMPSTTAPLDGTPFAVTVTALINGSNRYPGYRGTAHFSSTDALAGLPSDYTFTTADAGAHTFWVTLHTTGSQTITARDTANGVFSASTNVNLVQAGTLQITPSVTMSTAGTATTLTVTLRDSAGNVAAGYRGTLTFTSTDLQASLPANYTFTAADRGVHTFTITFKTAGRQFVTATDTAVPTIRSSAAVNALPAAANHFLVQTVASVQAGTPFAIIITARDAYNNLVPTYTGTVSLIVSNPGATLLTDDHFTTYDGGKQTLTEIFKIAGVRGLTVTDANHLTGSTSVTITPAAAASYGVTSSVSSTLAGTAFTVTVKALDSYGNVAPGYRGTVRLSSTDGQAVLPGDYTFTAADNGSHTFTVTLKTAGSQGVAVTDRATSLQASVPVTVTPAAAALFQLTGPISPVAAGTVVSLTLTALDQFRNHVFGYLGTVTFSSTDRLAGLPANYNFTAADQGAHTFPVLVKTAGGQTVTATDAPNHLTSSANVTVNPGPAALFALTGPNSLGAGTGFTLTVAVLDAYGNGVPGYRGTVMFTSSDGQAVLPANYFFTAADNGQHQFPVTLKTAGVQTVTAMDTVTSSITGVISITVLPAAVSQFAVAAPVSGTAGLAFSLTVTALDAYQNIVSTYTGTVTFTGSDAAASLPANYQFTPGDAGRHSFANGFTLRTAGTQVITVRDTMTGSLMGNTSLLVTLDPAVFQVTNTSDAGWGSLREALLVGNANPGLHTITFNITGAGVQTIRPAAALPTITNPVVLDGTSQPGYGGTPLIVLNGSSAGAGVNGLTISAGNSTVEGLVIDGFGGTGIVLQTQGGNVILANYIGTDAAGTAKVANDGDGILVTNGSANNTIGGTTPASRNLISGNLVEGIVLTGAGTTGNLVLGNLIGTDRTGTVALGNGVDGVAFTLGASTNTIGGTAAGARNVIAGNLGNGVVLYDVGTTGNQVQGNYIGVDVSGSQALGNGQGVILAGGASGNTIGGTLPGAGNVIAGNQGNGILMFGSTTAGNVIQGNLIGTDFTETVALGNVHTGIFLSLGTHDNLIGGTAPGAGNVIAGSTAEQGIALIDSGTSNNLIQGNFIGTDVTGTVALGNGEGVVITGGAGNNVLVGNVISGNTYDGIIISGSATTGNQVLNNLIGTDSTGTVALGNGGNGVSIVGASGNAIVANVIANNGNDGVLVDTGTNNLISQNSISASGNLGIELINNGNNNLAFPVLTLATSDGSTTTIQGTLTADPDTTYTIEFFANNFCNPSGYGEGAIYLGFVIVMTDDSGNASFTATFGMGLTPDQFLAATTTDTDNNTSSFSLCLGVTSLDSGSEAPGMNRSSGHGDSSARSLGSASTTTAADRTNAAPDSQILAVSASTGRCLTQLDAPSDRSPMSDIVTRPGIPHGRHAVDRFFAEAADLDWDDWFADRLGQD